MAIGYWALLILLLLAEYVAMVGLDFHVNEDEPILEFVWIVFVNYFVFASLCLSIAYIFYFLLIKWRRVGMLVSNFLLSCSILSEMVLFVYTRQTGLLLGAELFVRPIRETMITIQSFISIGWLILIVLMVIGFSMLILYFFARINK